MPPRLFSINGPLVLPRICIFCSQRLARPRIPAPKFTSLWINPRRARLYSSLIQSPTITTLRLHDAKAKLRHSLTELSTLNLANQSRVQLALRSLEQENAPVRIAVLGISSEEEAVKVVETGVSSSMAFPAKFLKVLLANHYSAEQDWEEKLTNWTGWSEGRGLLIQFSPTERPITAIPNTHLSILSCPSRFLETHNIEILFSALPHKYASSEDVYVPTLTAPMPSFALAKHTPNRSGAVMHYPVHKSLIFSNDLMGLWETVRIMSEVVCASSEREVVTGVTSFGALELPDATKSLTARGGPRISHLNLERVEEPLEFVRVDPRGEGGFEHEYFKSGMESIKNWILSPPHLEATTAISAPTPSDTSTGTNNSNRATAALIASILSNTSSALSHPNTSSRQSLTANKSEAEDPTTAGNPETSPNTDTLTTLIRALSAWSQSAHQDLHNDLQRAFSSREWKRGLAWYKIPFKYNKVGNSAGRALNGLLDKSDTEATFLAGRMRGAGFLPEYPIPTTTSPTTTNTTTTETILTPAQELAFALQAADPSPPPPKPTTPLPTTLPPSPHHPPSLSHLLQPITTTHIPTLLHTSHTLLLSTLRTTTLSLFTSSLLYFSSFPLYTSFSVSAFGIVWAMANLQTKWRSARKKFIGDVKEEGRVGVHEVERWAWGVLRAGVEEKVRVGQRNGGGEGEEDEVGKGKKLVEEGWEGLRSLNV